MEPFKKKTAYKKLKLLGIKNSSKLWIPGSSPRMANQPTSLLLIKEKLSSTPSKRITLPMKRNSNPGPSMKRGTVSKKKPIDSPMPRSRSTMMAMPKSSTSERKKFKTNRPKPMSNLLFSKELKESSQKTWEKIS